MEDKLEKAIKDLLVTADVVVLPEFGAFVATDLPAMVDSQNNTIYPPRRKVNFDDRLKTDDGLLIKHYANQERISRETATTHVNQFVEEIQHKLQRGNPWTVEDLGKFIVDGLNHLNFFPDPDHNFIPQSFGLPDVDLESVSRAQAMPVDQGSDGKAKKKEKHKKVGGSRKRSKALFVFLLTTIIAGGGAFIFFTKVDAGKHLLATAKEKVDAIMHPKAAEEVAKTAPAETAANGNYQPRAENIQFETPDRLDIEPTKMDEFVGEGNADKVKEENPAPVKKETVEPKKAAPVKEIKGEEKKVVAKAPVVTEAKKSTAAATTKPATTKPAEVKPKVEKPVPTVAKEEPKVAKVVEEEKLPLPKVNGKALRSNESIYSKYQIIVGEYRSMDEALRHEDGYTKVGYNAAIIQFKDGKFGVCLARSNDRTKAEKMLSEIRTQLGGGVKLKEY